MQDLSTEVIIHPQGVYNNKKYENTSTYKKGHLYLTYAIATQWNDI